MSPRRRPRPGWDAHLAEPADTAFARGRKRHAKTDKTDSRHLRQLLAEGRLPECWVPPGQVLEARALLEAYHDLRREHTAWVQRIHAVFFHQGAAGPGRDIVRTADGLDAVLAAAAAHLSAAGQQQVTVALAMMTCLEDQLHAMRRQLLETARHMKGARVLAGGLYGVGPVTALALTCWLGGAPVSSARKAVRFGLDITVYSSDGKRTRAACPGRGPGAALGRRRGRQDARPGLGPGPRLLRAGQGAKNGKRAALSEARKIIRRACHILSDLGDDAFAAA